MDQISTLKRQNEEQLISLLKGRDRRGFEMLYDNYSAALYGVILRIVKQNEVAEEALQDVFVNVWNKIDQYNADKGRLFTWIINIARNMAIDKLRSKEVKQSQLNDTMDDVLLNVVKQQQHTPNSDVVGLKDLLTRLEDEDSFVIKMLYFKGYSQSELAKDYNIPLGTVKTRTRRALKQLRSIMGIP